MINLKEGRAGFEAIGNTYPIADEICIESTRVAGIPCTWFIPEAAPEDDIVIFIHGGAFIYGSAKSHAPMVSHIARRLERKILLVDYRLAPEHPFPAGLNDCVAVIRSIAVDRPHLRFGIIGDSAGGNLAMAAQLALKEVNGPKAQYTAVISPWVNLECNTPSYIRNQSLDLVLAQHYLLLSAKMYAPDQELSIPLLSPVHGDFTGISPVLILCGTSEVLEDDSYQLLQQLKSTGVKAELLLFEEQQHVWPFMKIDTDASQQALIDIKQFADKYSPVNSNIN